MRDLVYIKESSCNKNKNYQFKFFPLVHPPSEQFILDYANDIGIVRGYVQLYVISMKIESNVNLSSFGDSQEKNPEN